MLTMRGEVMTAAATLRATHGSLEQAPLPFNLGLVTLLAPWPARLPPPLPENVAQGL